MSRPKYENSQSLSVERSTVNTFASSFEGLGKVSKLGLGYYVDFAVYSQKGGLYGFIECRRRYNDSTKYPDVFMNAAKYFQGFSITQFYGVPFIFLIEFNNGIYYTKIRDGYEIRLGGRSDRGDECDQEPCALVPVDEMVMLNHD